MTNLSPFETQIVQGLRRQGVYKSSIDELGILGVPNTLDVFETLKTIVKPMKGGGQCQDQNGFVIHASDEIIMENSEILKLGLSERILAIAENYFGLPPMFSGVVIRRDIANNKQLGTRYWHKDGEDTRIIKMIIYFEDIGTNDGPFCYIPLMSEKVKKFDIFDGSRVTDAEMTKKVSKDFQVECTGSACTVLLCWHLFNLAPMQNRRGEWSPYFIF